MTEHLPILRRVGWVLVIIGALDIGFMIYCIANQISYSSSLNIFAVVAGVFLIKGSLKAVRVIGWFAAFLFSGLLLALAIVFPWVPPFEYWILLFRGNPFGFVASLVLIFAVLFALYWVFRTLRSPPVLLARAAAGHSVNPPTMAFVAGAAFAVILAVALWLGLKGESAEQAVRLATEQYGSQYRYFVSAINWNGNHVSARLTAYNHKESKEVRVEWDR